MVHTVVDETFRQTNLTNESSEYLANREEFAQQAPAPDNTRTNADQNTADKQSNAASDRAMTQQVRKAIMQDKSMSTYAHNIKVVTQNGQVTLSGPARRDEEKRAIVQKAAEIAGQDHIVDQISVAAKQ